VVCNGTVGLEVGIRTLGLTGEVIVPSFTFVASAHALEWLGITPVFCDVHDRTHCIDPRKVEELITPRTSAILGVHLWGQPCAVNELADIAERRGLRLLFDAAHAFGCSYQGRMIGNFGSLEVFSFHATKFFNTFEGGAIVTNDDALAERIRAMRNFGYGRNDEIFDVGTNGKMNEVSAAMGLTGLESLPEFIAVNCANYQRYKAGLAGIAGVRLLSFDQSERCNYQYIVLEIEESITGISRDDLMEVQRAENVLARRYFHPGVHRLEPYRSRCPDAGSRFPVTERLANQVLALPTGTAVGVDEVSGICEIIRMVIAQSGEIRRHLAAARIPGHVASR
jgi:dTDP-4-amino-4,6-dideoxygalactose transaminase